jgi:hypothetical protein
VFSTSLFFSIYDNWTACISLQLIIIEHMGFIFISLSSWVWVGLNFNPTNQKPSEVSHTQN